MLAFIVLSFIAVASAQRLGYNYQQGVSGTRELTSLGSGISNSFLRGGQGFGFASNSGLGSGIGYGSGGLSFGNSYGGRSSGSSGSVIGGGQGGGVNYGGIGGGSNQVIDGGLSKEFYLYSAPQEQAREGLNRESVTTQIKKNLRVIFIKAPENNAVHNTALNLVKQATEDKTAIYVLSKEPDVEEISHQVQQINENVRAKPEVRFIKYRTPQDALNAQRQIQQQYEALGGSSQSSDEGIAPVLNFASPAEHHHSGAHSINYGGGNLFASGSLGSYGGSQRLNLGSLGSGSSLSGQYARSGRDYLPPAVKK